MNLSLDNMNNVQVNSYCSFVPGGTYNTITGNLLLDIQNNGCDASDILMKNTKVVLNDGINTGAAFTNDTANYTFFTQTGGFTLVPQFENNYFNVLPNPGTVNFTDTNSNIQNLSFCATPNGIHNDVEVTLVPLMTLRPGYDSPFRIVYKNKGNQSLSGTININFDDSILDFVSANPATVSQVLNNLNWNYINLLPFETRTIDFTLNLNTPTETPPVNSGDIINFTTSITPVANDETPNDNVFNSSELVLNSFDPNDKSCLEGNAIAPEKVGDYLHYVIRFQNTGSTSAQNIVVKDLIDTTKFDINTLQLTNSSHTNTARITGNKVEFIFENINLPAEIDNEAGSHGFVAFKIKTKNTLVLGNNVQNTANIYFDYNFPIVTNTTSTTVAVLNVKDFDDNSVSITPIPLETITSVQLFDIQGRLLQVKMADDTTATLDFDGKSNGVYLVKVYTAKGMKVQKVIKE